MTTQRIIQLLGEEANYLLSHQVTTIPKEQIHLPSPNHVKRTFNDSDRSDIVLLNLERLYNHGRLANTGYLSILPVDQGIEHIAGYSFSHNPIYFDPENIVKLALAGGCSAVASTLGILGLVSRKYADQIPFIVKLNHNELLTQPEKHDQHMFARVEQAAALGAAGVGATIYFGSKHSNRQIEEVSWAFARAHELGLFTILWCYPRNPAFKNETANYERSADITAQANYLGVTIEADIIKQKMPEMADGLRQLGIAKFNDEMYQKLIGNHPIDWVRYQAANCYQGKISLLNSGGGSDLDDAKQAVRTAVINKRGGGSGLIMGRKAFSKPFEQGVEILNLVQDVYLNQEISIA